MRVLFTVVPARTHLFSIVPVARALENAGHEVRVASTPDLVQAITGAGLTAVVVGEEVDLAARIHEASTDRRLDRITDTLGLYPSDEQLWYSIRYMLAVASMDLRAGSPRPARSAVVADLIAFTRAWQPDLLLWDPYHLASPIAARAAGSAHARLLWGLDTFAWTRAQLRKSLPRPGQHNDGDPLVDLIAPTLHDLGMEFDEELLVGQWSIDPMPPSMGFPLDLDYVHTRPVPFNGAAVAPDWLSREPRQPRVCLTLGVSRRDFFGDNEIPISDLSDLVTGLDMEIVATLNSQQIAWAAGGRKLPDNIRTVDYLPLNLVLPTCSAIVHHGGSGTFQTALSHRVPQLVVPGDHESTLAGKFITDNGAGLLLDPSDFSMEGLRNMMKHLTEEAEFSRKATELYRESLARPGPDELVHVLEERVGQQQG